MKPQEIKDLLLNKIKEEMVDGHVEIAFSDLDIPAQEFDVVEVVGEALSKYIKGYAVKNEIVQNKRGTYEGKIIVSKVG